MHLQFLLNLCLYCTVGWVKCHTPGGFRAKVINLAQLTNAVTKVKSRVCLAFHPAGVFVELNWTLQRGRRWLGVAALPCRNAAVLMCAASVACQASSQALEKGQKGISKPDCVRRLLVSFGDFLVLVYSVGTI